MSVPGRCSEKDTYLLLISDVLGGFTRIYVYIERNNIFSVYIDTHVCNHIECANLESSFHPFAVKIKFRYWHCVDSKF